MTRNYNLSLGLSATWSRPLDKNYKNYVRHAATTQIGLQNQMVANKRLDFEIARLKNCGELDESWNYVPSTDHLMQKYVLM